MSNFKYTQFNMNRLGLSLQQNKFQSFSNQTPPDIFQGKSTAETTHTFQWKPSLAGHSAVTKH
jgi:hypothetical protein